MPRSVSAQLAIDMYEALRAECGWSAANAWQGIARLLLSCDTLRHTWQPFHDVVAYRAANDFKTGVRGPNVVIRRAEALTGFLAGKLGVSRTDLSNEISAYWWHPDVTGLQPHHRPACFDVRPESPDPGLNRNMDAP